MDDSLPNAGGGGGGFVLGTPGEQAGNGEKDNNYNYFVVQPLGLEELQKMTCHGPTTSPE